MREFILRTFADDEAETCQRCNMQELVRCKDCKRRETYECPVHVGCGGDGYDEPDDWFCADGERKEGR